MHFLIFLAYWAIRIWQILIFAWALMSWFQPDPRNPLVRIIHALVEPILLPFQKLIPPMGGISFSAMAAMIVLELINDVFLRALQS